MRETILAALIALTCAAAAAEQPGPAARMRPCTETAGPKGAALMVRQCIQVSPATHPPCNADNACGLIRDEIIRGCSLFRTGQAGSAPEPEFCKDYLSGEK
ncbi:MAG TPA: hypothetical protein VMV26_15995 [Alphaproteobacteria bacterium]|jgi:hypothetical protein|nr:hypothetical protein [Alphaproteobacteria bacterium]